MNNLIDIFPSLFNSLYLDSKLSVRFREVDHQIFSLHKVSKIFEFDDNLIDVSFKIMLTDKSSIHIIAGDSIEKLRSKLKLVKQQLRAIPPINRIRNMNCIQFLKKMVKMQMQRLF